jgi:hypothetical protein
MTTDERALTEDKILPVMDCCEQCDYQQGYLFKDLRAALELLREKLDQLDQHLDSGPTGHRSAVIRAMHSRIDECFPVFAKEEKEPQGPILKKVPCVNCGWNYVYRIDGQ